MWILRNFLVGTFYILAMLTGFVGPVIGVGLLGETLAGFAMSFVATGTLCLFFAFLGFTVRNVWTIDQDPFKGLNLAISAASKKASFFVSLAFFLFGLGFIILGQSSVMVYFGAVMGLVWHLSVIARNWPKSKISEE